jgi:glutamate 5-kinase
MNASREQIAQSKRLVIKVGSALVTANGTGLAREFIADCARQIALLRERGLDVLLVSSGAIAAGMQRLGWKTRPAAMHDLQAAAAVGQMGLAQAYESVFLEHGLGAAQILLTHEDLADRQRYLNARNTLNALLAYGVVPIINENDTVVTDEIKFGDNDTLGALVTHLSDADGLIILTDQSGLYTADPRRDPDARLIHEGYAGDPQWEAAASGSVNPISKGGMITKVRAAARAAKSGAYTVIVSGHEPDVLLRTVAGEVLGTLLVANQTRLAARKQWLVDHLKLAGELVLDDGAAQALRSGCSLLPIGVSAVSGEFERGSAVLCRDQRGQEIARGLVNYSSSEARLIMGRASHDIARQLGMMDEEELIHRDNLVLI